MVITWYGEGCFKIQTGETVILTDPFESKTGLTPARLKADITLKTINPFPPIFEEAPEGSYIVSGAGEYNFKDINISGFALSKESAEKFLKTIYLVEAERIKLCFLGHISEPLEPAVVEHLEEVDILFVPAGGKPFLDQKSATKLIKHLEPGIVIPSLFKIPGLTRQSSDIKSFLEEINHKKPEAQEKLTLKKKDLLEMKSTQVVVLRV